MGITKRCVEDEEALRQQALSLLVEVGALEECEIHSGTYFDGNGDLEAAYRLANARITSREVELDDDMSRRDFTDIIKKAYEENYVLDECPACKAELRD